MARTQVVDSATSQFFINVNDNDFLNHTAPTPQGFGYAVFGKVTDGMDTASEHHSFDDNLMAMATAGDTTVFTIAYGDDADDALLSALAAQGNGNFYRGDEASIAAIYEEMSAAFGGSLGVGR